MKKQFLNIILFLFLSGLFACTSNKTSTPSLNQLDWLIGTWQGTSKSGNIFYERWHRINDTLFSNVNYHFEGMDTVFGGHSKIILSADTIFYINDSDPLKELKWAHASCTPSSVTFINKKATPYSSITFSLSEKNTWDAVLSGSKDSTHYSLKRIN